MFYIRLQPEYNHWMWRTIHSIAECIPTSWLPWVPCMCVQVGRHARADEWKHISGENTYASKNRTRL
jgi:hypothetical protein